MLVLSQLLQVAGAVTILAAFTLAQLRVLDVRSAAYLAANLVGAALLAVLAWHERQWGFLLLEGVWALVSLSGLVERLAGAPSKAAVSGAGHPTRPPRTRPVRATGHGPLGRAERLADAPNPGPSTPNGHVETGSGQWPAPDTAL